MDKPLVMNVYGVQRRDDGTVEDQTLLRSVELERGAQDPKDPAYYMWYEKGEPTGDLVIEIAEAKAEELGRLDAMRSESVPQ